MIIKPQARSSWGYALASVVILALTFLSPSPTPAQGCAQCREAVGQTPARTRQAYRRGISILVLAASGIFIASVTAIRRFR